MPAFIIVAFDFDGTLVDSRSAIINSMQATFREFNVPPPTGDDILSKMGIPVERSFPIFHKGAVDEATTKKMVDRYRELYLEESKTNLTLYPGIAELLSALHAAGCRVGVVTSKKADAAWANARQLKIDSFLEEIVGAHEVTKPKPDPEPLRVLCRAFGRYPDHSTLVIGDATYDIEMATRAGARSCAVTWGAHSEAELKGANPTYVARSAAELNAIFDFYKPA